MFEKSLETTKFFAFDQNNSGGYYLRNYDEGICANVIIEAINAKKASQLAEMLFSGYSEYCDCCGERWYTRVYDDESMTEEDIEFHKTRKSEFSIIYLDGRVEIYNKDAGNVWRDWSK